MMANMFGTVTTDNILLNAMLAKLRPNHFGCMYADAQCILFAK